MGCSNVEEKEEKVEKEEKEGKEEKEEKEIENSEKEEEEDKESHNLDKETLDYFSNFNEKEISLILSKRKSINIKNNFCFLYSKFEVIYNDKFLSKKNKILCTEFLVCYLNPNYIGNFGYESQIVGFFPKSVKLIECYIKEEKIEAKMINNGKIISILKIKEDYKNNLMNDIIIFEFIYNIIQIKDYGIRLININYQEDLLTCSMKIKYDEDKFSINSDDKSTSFKKNELYIFNKNKFCLTLKDKDNIISLNDKKNKINKLINNKFTSEEIEKINNCLKDLNIKPLKTNLIYEKIKHELYNKTDYIEGSLLILHPSFEKYYFDLFEVVSNIQNNINFKINQLHINDKTIINLNNSETHNKSDNYYKTSNNSYYYNISTKEDFILFEFKLESIEVKEEKKKIKYDLDPKKIFNILFSKGTYYLFEIILNGQNVTFENKKNYKYKKNEEKIIFEGNWELDGLEEEKSIQYLPKEIILKIK